MVKRGGSLNPVNELDKLAHRSVESFVTALNNVVRAEFIFQKGEGGLEQRDKAIKDLSELLGHTLTLADLTGRRRLLLNADREGGKKLSLATPPFLFHGDHDHDTTYRADFEKEGGPISPRVDYLDAIKAMASRDPRLAEEVAPDLPRWKAVQMVYTDQYAFALAKSSSLEVTKKVQKLLGEQLETREEYPDAISMIAALGDWTSAYSETVYRTNLNTAFADGIMNQSKNAAIRVVIGGLAFSINGDSVTRPNHRAVDKMTAPVDHQIWETFKPPLGYNCRCTLRQVTHAMMERNNLIENGTPVAGIGSTPYTNDADLIAAMRNSSKNGYAGPDMNKDGSTFKGTSPTPGVGRPYSNGIVL